MEDISINGLSLKQLFMTTSLKWIFVGGKGGVGKTTTACSIAVQLAARRNSVLIISTDPAHNLSDAFGQKFFSTPTLVDGFTNLFALEIDTAETDSAEYKLSQSDDWTKHLPDLVQAIPGIDETLSLAKIMQLVTNFDYSTIVFDTAPTGHTLRLLELPTLLDKGLKLMSNVFDKYSSAIKMMSSVAGMNMNEKEMKSTYENLKALTSLVRENFVDSSKTTFVCVCIPEFLSVYETERLIQELAMRGIDCSYIVVNQVLFEIVDEEVDEPLNELATKAVKASDDAMNEENERLKKKIERLQKTKNFLEKAYLSRRKMQSKYLTQIRDLYSYDFHVTTVPQLHDEVRGEGALRNFGNILLKAHPIPLMTESELGRLSELL